MRISDWSSDVCSSDLADRLLVRRPVDVGPVGEVRRLEEGRARSVESEMRVAGGRAIGNHRDRLGGRVSRTVEDLDVEDGGKRSEEGSVGKGWCRRCGLWWAQDH